MHVFQPVDPVDVDEGAFTFIGDSLLVTSMKGDKVNSMTASWGGVGYLWNKRVIVIYVRGSRYTREFLDESGVFSLSFLDQKEFRGVLKFMGAVSGRNEDKIAGARLTINYDDGIPFIDEAGAIVTARVLYKQELDRDGFVDESLVDEFYRDGDYHIMYVGELNKILVR